MFAALAGWRGLATHLARRPSDEAREEAEVVLRRIPQELRSTPDAAESARWMADPVRLQEVCEAAVRTLIALPVGAPSLRLLADQAAKTLAGVAQALQGLALLVADPARPLGHWSGVRLRVPDWLPSCVNAGRALVAIGAAELFWILTAWPNGTSAIIFATVPVLLFPPRADQAYAVTLEFMIGTALAAVFAAIVKFAVLPGLATFTGFSLALGLLPSVDGPIPMFNLAVMRMAMLVVRNV